jgi:hypothetical protein
VLCIVSFVFFFVVLVTQGKGIPFVRRWRSIVLPRDERYEKHAAATLLRAAFPHTAAKERTKERTLTKFAVSRACSRRSSRSTQC